VSFTTDHKVFIKTSDSTGGCCVAVVSTSTQWKNLSWELVSAQNVRLSHCLKMEQRNAALCKGARGATGGQSGCLECHVFLRWRALPLGPQRTQGLPLPTHCIQRQLQCGVHCRALEYSVLCSSMVQSHVMFTSVCWAMNLSICWCDMASLWIQPSFHKLAPEFTPAMPYFAFFMTSSRAESFQTGILRYMKKGLPWPPTSLHLNPFDYFLWGHLKDRVFPKNPHTIPKFKTGNPSEVEAIYTETLIKVLNNSVLRLHEVRDLTRHHTRNVLV
jgi:hypothetical protein